MNENSVFHDTYDGRWWSGCKLLHRKQTENTRAGTVSVCPLYIVSGGPFVGG